MSDAQDPNNENPLNDAVEQSVNDGSAESSSEAEEQNKNTTSTVANTAASGDVGMDDSVQASSDDGESGSAGDESGEGDSSEGSSGGSSGGDSSGSSESQSGVVEGGVSDAGDQASAEDGGGDDVGAQAVGGDAESGETSSKSGTDVVDPKAADSGVAQGAEESLSDAKESFDSETTEETFSVDVVEDAAPVEDFDTTTVEETYTFGVQAVNDGPEVSQDQSLTGTEDSTRIITQDELLAYASDVDNPDDLVAENLTLDDPDMGTIVDNGDGTFSFTPAQDFNGEVSFSYDVSDGIDSTSTNLTIDVAAVNDAAVGGEPTIAGSEDSAVYFTDSDLLANATDVEGDDLSVQNVSYAGDDGTLTESGSIAFGGGTDGQVRLDETLESYDEFTLDFTYTSTGAHSGGIENLFGAATSDAGNNMLNVYVRNSDGGLGLDVGNTDSAMFGSLDLNDGQPHHISISWSAEDGVMKVFDNGELVGTDTLQQGITIPANGLVILGQEQDTYGGGFDSTQATSNAELLNFSMAYERVDDASLEAEADLSTVAANMAFDLRVENGEIIDATGQSGVTTNGDVDTTLAYRFDPNENFNGEVTLDYEINDGTDVTSTSATLDIAATNDAADVSGNVTVTLDEDGSITLTQADLLANASDIEGDSLTASLTGVENATLTDNGDGSYTITPDENFNGELNFTMNVSDGTDLVQSGLDVTVNAVNDNPVASNDGNVGSLVLDGDDSLQLNVGNNDIHGQVTSMWFKIEPDAEGPQGLFGIIDPGNGNDRDLYLNEDGDMVAYTWDSSGQNDYTTTNVGDLADGEWHHVVYSLGDGGNQIYIDGELAASGDLSQSDFDWSSAMTLGTSHMAGDMTGEIRDFQTYTNISATQDDVDALMRGDTLETTQGVEPQFRMQFEEGSEFVVEGSNAHIIGESPVITGNPEVSQSLEGSTIAADDVITNFDVLSNDFDIDGDSFSITGLSDVVNADGTVLGTLNVVEIDGVEQVQFMPDSDAAALEFGEFETAQFTYTITDEHGATDTANVVFKMQGTNSTPEVNQNLAVSVDEDSAITLTQADLLTHATDADGDSLAASNLAITGDATLTNNGDGTFTITPDADFNGEIGITFDITDGDRVIEGNADLTVNAVNDLPVTNDVSATTAEDTSITLSQDDLLANASDIDGDNLTADNLVVANAMVTDNGDGSFSILPDPHFNGELTVSYDINDGTGTIAGTLNLSVTAVNDAAIVDTHDVVVNEDGTLTFTDEHLLANVEDFDDEDTHSIDSVSYSGEDGVFADNGDGTYSFAPNEHFNGDVVLDFVVDDGTETTASTINVDVTAVNDAPIAGSTSFSMNEDGVITLSDAQLLANSSDIDGDDLSIDNVEYTGDDGTLVDNDDGTFTFTPNANFNGEISLNVSVSDGIDISTTTAAIDVAAVNDLPSFPDPTYTMDEDTTIVLTADDIISQATDIDGDDLTLEAVSYVGDDGTLVDNGDGTYSFTPSENFNGDIDLTATVNDGSASVDATVHLQVDAVNDAATSDDVDLVGTEDTTITITQADLLANASDIDGDELTASNLTIDPSFGAVTDNGDGTFDFSPTGDYNGDVPFSFTLSDGTATTNVHGNIDVAAANDTPVLAETSFALTEDNSIVITEAELLANASDIDGDALSVTNISTQDGSVTQNGDGDWVYTPTENYSGDASLTITLSDGTTTADFNSPVTIDADADAPSLTVSLQQMSVAEFGDANIQGGVLQGWQTDNQSGGIEVNQDWVYGVGDDRGLVMELEAAVGDEANVYQNLDIEAGDTIELSFDISARVGSAGADSQVDVYFEGQLIDSILPEVGWESHTYTLTATTDNPRLELDSPSHNGGGAVLDVIRISAPTATQEETAIGLDIDAALVDTDGSESMQSIEVESIPEGAVLTDGTNTFTATADSDSVDVIDWNMSSITITTPENFAGDVTLQVTATSEEGANGDTASASSDLTFTVEDVNDAVVIDVDNEPTFNATEDTQFTITEAALLSNASDIDSDDLIVTNLQIPNASFNTVIDPDTGDKSFVVTPDENFNGDVDISFSVSDQEGSVVESGASLTVAAVNDGPVAVDDSATANEGETILIDVLANDSDIESDVSIQSVDETVMLNGVEVGTAEIVDIPVMGQVELNASDATSTSNLYGGTLLEDDSWSAGHNIIINGENYDSGIGMHPGDGLSTATFEIPEGATNFSSILGMTSSGLVNVSVRVDGVGVFDQANVTANSDGGIVDIDVTGGSTLTLLVHSNGTKDNDHLVWANPEFTAPTGETDQQIQFTPNENFTMLSVDEQADVTIDYVIVDEDGATDSATATITVSGVNSEVDAGAPVTASIDEDGSITLSQEDLLANASDVDGDDLTASNLNAGDNATVTDNGDGTFTVTPDANFNGDLDLTFDISDGNGSVVESAVDISVTPVNDIPEIANVVAVSQAEEASVVVDPAQLINILPVSDIDGDTLTITNMTYEGDDGTFVDNGDGTYTITGNDDFVGTMPVTYTIDDGNGGTAQGTINVEVTNVNDLPTAGDPLSATMQEDGSYTFTNTDLLVNANDIDGDVISVSSVALADGADGTLIDNGDGSFTYQPSTNFNGDIQIDYTISDGNGDPVSNTLDVTVEAVNDGPSVDVSGSTVNEDGTLIITQDDLLANATDIDGDDITASNLQLAPGSTEATIQDNGDGTFTVTPDADFNGSLAFTFDATDGTETVQAMHVTTVEAVNDAATSDDVDLVGTEDTTITITQADLLANASDIDGDELTASNLTIDPSFGAVTDNGDGTFDFAPTGDYNGDVPFSFTLSDGTATTNVHGNIDVAAANDTPVLAETSFALTEDNSIVITEAELLANASDIDGDALSVTNITATDGNGSVTQNEDGDWVYTPAENYSGDANLTISLNDGTVTADFDSAVTITPDADAPSLTVALGEMSVAEFGDANIQGGVLQGWQTDNQSGGIEVNQDWVYGVGDDRGLVMELEAAVGDEANVYQNLDIEAGDTIELSFDISARVGSAGADSQVDVYFEGQLIDSILPEVGWESHTYTLTATTDNPRLELDSPSHNGGGAVLDVIRISEPSSTDEDTAITLDIDAALVDTDGSESMQSIEVAAIPEGAVLTDGSNTFTATAEADSVEVGDWDLSSLTITTAENFSGDVTLDISATSIENENGDTETSTAQLNFTVEEVNDAVVIDAGNEPSFNATEDTQFTITEAALLSNASDLDSEDLIVTNLQIPNATFNTVIDPDTGDKSFAVTPDANFNGDVDISFSVSDQEGSVVESGASLTVAAVNDAADVSGNVGYTIDEDGSITLTQDDLLANASDVDGDNLTATLTSVANATLADNGDGSYTITPDENFNGELNFSMDISDGTEVVQSGVDITVNAVNDGPVAVDDGEAGGALQLPGGGSIGVPGGANADNGEFTVSMWVKVDPENQGEQGLFSVGTYNSSGADRQISMDADGNIEAYAWQSGVGAQHIESNVGSLADGEWHHITYSLDGDNQNLFIDGELAAQGSMGTSGFDWSDVVVIGDDWTHNPMVGEIKDVQVYDGYGASADDAQQMMGGDTIDGQDALFHHQFNGDNPFNAEGPDGEITSTVWGSPTVEAEYLIDGVIAADDVITNFDVLANDSDVEGDVSIITLSDVVDADGNVIGAVSVVEIDGQEQVQFSPNATVLQLAEGEQVLGQFTYEIIDNEGAKATANVSFNFEGTNDTPVVSQNAAASVDEDGSITLTQADLLVNASDVDGDTLVAENLSIDGNASVVNNGDGTFTITPDTDWNGQIDVSFDVTDGTETVSAGLDLTVNAVNDLPTTTPVTANTLEDNSITVTQDDLLANAADIDGGPLTAENLTIDGPAMVTDNGDGSFTINPDPNFNGELNLSYDINDGTGTVDGSLNINVTAVNDAATSTAVGLNGTEDTSLTITQADLLTNASDIDGDALTAVNLSIDESFGSLTDNGDGSWNFEPADDFNGQVPFTFQIDDGTELTAANGNVNVGAVNDLPTLDSAVTFSATEDEGLVINAADILANASDVDGDALSVTDISSTDGNTTILNNGDGTFTLYGDDNFAGTDNLEITISDGTDTATFSSSVEVAGTADEPFLALNLDTTPLHSFTVTESGWQNPAVWGWSTDNTGGDGGAGFNNLVEVNQASGTYGVTGSTEGTVLELEGYGNDAGNLWKDLDIQAGETFTIEFDMSGRNNLDPQSNHVKLFFEGEEIDQMIPEIGFETFSYTLTATEDNPRFEFQAAFNDGAGALLDRVTVTKADLSADEDNAVAIDISAALADNDGSESLEVEISGLLENAVLTDGVNSFTATADEDSVDVSGWDLSNLSMTPPENFNGDASLTATATATDAGGDTATSTMDIPITINAVNDAVQVGDNLAVTIDEDGSFTMTQEQLLANASDLDGDDLTAQNLQSSNASITDNGDGTFTVSPDANFNGDLDVTFDVTDNNGSTIQSNIDVTVTAVNDGPTVDTSLSNVAEDGIITITQDDLLANAVDIDGDDITASNLQLAPGSTEATIQDNGDGSFTVTPEADFNGELAFTFDATDGTETVQAMHVTQVTAVNDAAQASDNTITATEDTAYQLSSADFPVTDADGDDYTVTIDSIDGEGSLILGYDTSLPEANFTLDTTTNSSADGVVVTNDAELGQVYTFDSPDTDVIDLDTNVEMGESWTVSVDFQNPKLNDGQWSTLTRGDVSDGGNHHILLHGTTNEIGVYSNDHSQFFGSGFFLNSDHNDGQFHNLTAVGEGGETHFYIDGEFVGSSAHQVTNSISEVGNFDHDDDGLGNHQPFAGSLANFEVFDDALTAEQIDGLVNGNQEVQPGDNLTQSQLDQLTFVPDENAHGDGLVDIGFHAVDENGLAGESATLSFNVTSVDDETIVNDTNLSVDEDNSITITDEQLLANASDADHSLSIENFTLTSEDAGTLVDNGDGTYAFIPDADFNGQVQFDYDVSNGTDATAGNAFLEVNPVNDAPVMTRVDFNTSEDGAITVNAADILANASDVDGDVLSVASISSSDGNSSVVDNGDGTFTITPDEHFAGAADLTITLSDGTTTAEFASTLNVVEVADAAQLAFAIEPAANIIETEIFNEDFEDITAGLTDIDQWGWATATPSNHIEVNDESAYLGAFATGDHGQVVELETYGNSSWAGIMRDADGVEVGDTFTLSFDAAARAGATGDDGIHIRVQTENGFEAFDVEPVDGAGWGSYEFTFTATVDNPTIIFNSHSDDGAGGIMDNIRVVAQKTDDTHYEDTAVNVDLSATLVDTDGSETLSLELSDIPAGVTLSDGTNSYTPESDGGSINVDGWNLADLTLMPPENFSGEISITATAATTDGDSTATNSETISVDIVAVNDAVEVGAELTMVIDEDGSFTMTQDDLLANATDVDGDDLAAGNLQVQNATVTDNGDGSFTVAPDADYNGSLNVSFDVSDGNGSTVQSGIDVTVNPVNDIPEVANAVAVSQAEEASVVVDPAQLINILPVSDVDGDTLTITNMSYDGDDGTFVDNGDGTYTITGNDDFVGTMPVTYTIDDGNGGQAQGTINVEVTNVNDLPTAGDPLSATMQEDGSYTFTNADLLVNANDVDGDVISVSSVSLADGADGTLTDNGDGSFTYEPSANFNGDIQIDYTISDGNGDPVSNTLDVTVEAVNDGPSVDVSSSTVNEDGTLIITQDDLLANATDIDGDDITASNLQLAPGSTEATIQDNGDGTFTVAPDADFNGSLAFTFDATDGTETVQAMHVTTVESVNDAVVVGDNVTATIDEDGSLTLTQEQLLANATDADGDDLTASNLQVANATVTDNGNGSFTIAPDANFNGALDVTYDISDGNGSTVQSGVDITVNAVNDGPVVAGGIDMSEDFSGNAEGWVAAGDATIADGEVTLTEDTSQQAGAILYDEEMPSDQGIQVSFTMGNQSATDNGDGMGFVLVNGDQIDGNNFEAGNPGGSMGIQGMDGMEFGIAFEEWWGDSIQLIGPNGVVETFDLGNDVIDNQTIPVNIDISPEGVLNVQLSYDGGTTFVTEIENYSLPDNGINLPDSVKAAFAGGTGGSTAEHFVDDISIFAAGGAGSSTSMQEDGTITITQEDLLENASDIDGDALTALNLAMEDDSQGTLVDNGDGTFSFTPTENFNGEIAISYDVTDGEATTSATYNVNVEGVNDAPDAPTVELVGTEDQVLTIDPAFILAQATDLDGDDLTLTNLSVRQPQNAQLNQQQDGTYQLVASQDFNGVIELDYQISDGTTTTDGTLNTDFQPVNDAAFASGNAHLAIEEDGAITFNADDMLDLFSDVDGDTVAISRVILPDDEEGSLTDNGDGTYTYVGAEDFAGIPQLELVVTDGTEETTLDLPVYIRPVADGAVITRTQDGPIVMTEDETGIFSFSVGLIDDSESISNVAITGFPVGFVLSDGTNTITITEENQYVDVTGWDTENIAMTPPENWAGTFEVTVSATTIDYGDEQVTDLDGSTVPVGDFETNAGEPVTFTEADLLEMSGLETSETDSVQLAHLADRSQGDLVDNGDGTYTFTPADGFSGEVGMAFLVVDENGNSTDAQSSIAVFDNAGGGNSAPTADTEITTNIDAGNSLNFTDADLLSTVNDADGDDLSISGVEVIGGEGVVLDHGDGTYTFTPDEGVTGDVAIGFSATDGTSTIQSQLNVAIADPDPAEYTMAEDGSLTLTTAELLDQVGAVDSTGSIDDVTVDPDAGTVIDNGDGTYTFWSDPDYNGTVQLQVSASDANNSGTGNINLTITAENDAPEVSGAVEADLVETGTQTFTLEELLANVSDVDGDNLTVSNFQSDHATMTDNGDGTYTLVADENHEGEVDMTFDVSDGTETVQASLSGDTRPDAVADGIDAQAAPGGSVSVSIPTDISGDASVDSVVIGGLPEGATLSSGIDNGDGSYTLSGDLSQPVSMTLGDNFEGTAVLDIQGMDQLNNPVDGAEATTSVEVSSDYALDGSSADNAEAIDDTVAADDWTTAAADAGGVDPLADTGGAEDNTPDQNNGGDNDPNDYI